MTAAEPSGGAGATSVAIIMDGNGRWATERGLPVLEGHRRGAKTMKQTVMDAVALGIRELTVYAFSTENWSRPEDEVAGLMEMFAELIVSETPELDEEGVRMRFVGSRRGVSDRLLEQMDWAEAETRANTRLLLFVAFNYGGRAEILDAAARYEGGGEDAFAKLLYAPDMSDPELVIRTSGEQRLSNFLLWQSAYSELHFSDCLWPDFDRAELERALRAYGSRRRRFGARDSDR
jgi:undecaprenyl diphosphate synthase